MYPIFKMYFNRKGFKVCRIRCTLENGSEHPKDNQGNCEGTNPENPTEKSDGLERRGLDLVIDQIRK